MPNELDETNPIVNENGRDVTVIEKQIPVTVGKGSKVFEVLIWFLPPIIGGIIYLLCKVSAGNYLSQLQQRLQHDASTIDNYLEQRVVILKNVAALLDKSIDLDKSTYKEIAALRSGNGLSDAEKNEVASKVENANVKINAVMEAYPDLKAHNEIQSAMNQNSYLQKEITAAREVYNDTVNQWNHDIYVWPCKQIVAAKRGYTTRIPFSVSKAVKEEARGTFF